MFFLKKTLINTKHRCQKKEKKKVKLEKFMQMHVVREVSFFTGRGAPENWGNQVLFLRSKGGIKRFFKFKREDHLYILKK